MRRGWRWGAALGVAALSLNWSYALPLGSGNSVPRLTSPRTWAASQRATHSRRCARRNKETGTLTIGGVIAQGFDPHDNLLAAAGALSVDNLFFLSRNGALAPRMAATVPTLANGGIRDGGKTYIIHLRKGVHWSDGSEVTSADVKFGWQVGRDGAPLPHTCQTDGVCRVDTPDRYTVVFHLPRANASFLFSTFLNPTLPYILPLRWAGFWNHNVHAAAVALNTKLPSGSPGFPSTGPYQTVRLVGGQRVIMRPMPYYTTLNCGGHIRKLVFAQYASVAELVAAAATHRVDITAGWPGFFPGPTASDVPLLEQHTGSYRLRILPGSYYSRLLLMVDRSYHGRPNPLASMKVRLALALGLDREGLVRRALALNAQQIRNLISWTPWPNTPVLRAPGTDRRITGQWDPLDRRFLNPTGRGRALADARALLASTPWAHGLTLDLFTTINNPARYAAATFLARSWARLGVHLNLHFVSGAGLFSDWNGGGIVAHGAFQVGLWADPFLGDGALLNTGLQRRYIETESMHSAATGGDPSHIRDAVFDRDFDLLPRTTGQKARDRLLAAIQQELNRKAYWIMLWIQPNIATTDNRVIGFNPGLAPPYYDEQNWRVRGR